MKTGAVKSYHLFCDARVVLVAIHVTQADECDGAHMFNLSKTRCLLKDDQQRTN